MTANWKPSSLSVAAYAWSREAKDSAESTPIGITSQDQPLALAPNSCISPQKTVAWAMNRNETARRCPNAI